MRSSIHYCKTVCMAAIAVGATACVLQVASEPDGGLTPTDRSRLHVLLSSGETPLHSIDVPGERALLQRASRPIRADAPMVDLLIEHLERTARRHSAMGIAAVQVGIPVRIALLRRTGQNGSRTFQAFLNPEIIGKSASTTGSWEHCLSVPWGYRFTRRPRQVNVRYQNAEGNTVNETLQNDEAIVFQQEMDHLDGKLLSDGQSRASFIPPDHIAGFASAIRRQCLSRILDSEECDELMRQNWEERLRAKAPKPKGNIQ